MPKRKTADATIEKAVPAAEPKKRVSATRAASTATHKRTATKKAAAQPFDVPGNAAPEVTAAVEPVTSPVVESFAAPTHAEIARLAYSYFEQRGYQPGDPVADWLRAERELAKLA